METTLTVLCVALVLLSAAAMEKLRRARARWKLVDKECERLAKRVAAEAAFGRKADNLRQQWGTRFLDVQAELAQLRAEHHRLKAEHDRLLALVQAAQRDAEKHPRTGPLQ